MDPEYDEEGVMSILRRRKGWNEELSSISEFKEQLEEGDLAHEELKNGWVLWRENERQHQILTLIKNIVPPWWSCHHIMVQYWGVEKVEGKNHYLSTSNYPFSVDPLSKGLCWYRKLCRDHVYIVDVDDRGQQQIGGVGRAYRNKQPESSPDLRLYSTDEFPMRDEAARCGFRCYLALPLFHSHTNTGQCFGVLELLWDDALINIILLPELDTALQDAGLRSTHSPIVSRTSSSSASPKQMLQVDSEIREILELAMLTVPRLYLTQVWVPCQQCVCVNIINTNSCYMHIESFKRSENDDDDFTVWAYHKACRFLNLQIDVSKSFDSNLCDMSISKNPLAHYAQRARINMSHSFAISLQSLHDTNHLYLIHFFLLQSKFREDDNACALLFKMMNMNLKRFNFVPGERLVSESQNSNAIECESTDSLSVMNSYKQVLSIRDFMTYSCCLQSLPEESCEGWVFVINDNSSLVPTVVIKKKIENFMKNIAFDEDKKYWIIQFWVPKMVEDGCYLQALDQPFVVSCLSIGLASFRKKCTTHSYRVDDQAIDKELGPPGRVFRNGHPEMSPDLFHYTTSEYPIRNYVVHYCSLFNPGYLALPIFEDEHNHKCVGMLEVLGFQYSDLAYIRDALEEAKLCSIDTALHPSYADDQNYGVVKIIYGREEALTEVRNALDLICKIPQLYMAHVWVPNGECVTSINTDMTCMALALPTDMDDVCWIHVQTRKGMVGMVLASENKSCLCQNLCEFSIVDQPLSHFEMRDRCEVCFAICLQSSHTGDLVYVLEFFLYQGPKTYEYLRSFLNFLLPIMKHQLPSFKMASGKQLGEELVIEVIEFSDANRVDSSESDQTGVFPIRFKSVQYSQKEHRHSNEQQIVECSVEHQHSEEQQTKECRVVVEHQHTVEYQIEERRVEVHIEEQQREERSIAIEHHHSEEQQIEECSAAASDSKRKKRQKRKTKECSPVAASDSKRKKQQKRKTQECSPVAASDSKTGAKGKSKPRHHLTLEDLQPLSRVEKLKDVRKILNVSKATLYRAREKYGLLNWPGKLRKDLLPTDSQPSTSTSNIQPLDTNSGSTRNVINVEEEEEAEKVIIKLKYVEDIIKFELCLSLGVSKLFEQVATELNLEMGTYKLKYRDEDNDEISLTPSSDLHLCPKSQTAMGRTCIQFFVHLISK